MIIMVVKNRTIGTPNSITPTSRLSPANLCAFICFLLPFFTWKRRRLMLHLGMFQNYCALSEKSLEVFTSSSGFPLAKDSQGQHRVNSSLHRRSPEVVRLEKGYTCQSSHLLLCRSNPTRDCSFQYELECH